MKIIAGNSNIPLAKKIASFLGVNLVKAEIGRFSDREVFVEINENITNEEIFIIQSTSDPANDNIMELLVTIDAVKRGGASKIISVIPYYGYSRQDRCVSFGSPISAKLVSNMIAHAGSCGTITMDLHSNQIEGFFDTPIQHLSACELFAKHIQEKFQDQKILIASPDIGGVKRARDLAKILSCDIVFIDKKRDKNGESRVTALVGDVHGSHVILVDDILDSGNTICNAAEKLKESGAVSVSAYVTHGVFSGNAAKKLAESSLSYICFTDTILLNSNLMNQIESSRIEQISIAEIFAHEIAKISRHN